MRRLRPRTTQQEMARLGFKTKPEFPSLRGHAASQITQLEVESWRGIGQYGKG